MAQERKKTKYPKHIPQITLKQSRDWVMILLLVSLVWGVEVTLNTD